MTENYKQNIKTTLTMDKQENCLHNTLTDKTLHFIVSLKIYFSFHTNVIIDPTLTLQTSCETH